MGHGARNPAQKMTCQGGLFQSSCICVHRNVHTSSQLGGLRGLEKTTVLPFAWEERFNHKRRCPSTAGTCPRDGQGWLCNHPISKAPPFPDIMLLLNPRAPALFLLLPPSCLFLSSPFALPPNLSPFPNSCNGGYPLKPGIPWPPARSSGLVDPPNLWGRRQQCSEAIRHQVAAQGTSTWCRPESPLWRDQARERTPMLMGKCSA